MTGPEEHGPLVFEHPTGAAPASVDPSPTPGSPRSGDIFDPMEAWKSRGRELNAIYDVIAAAISESPHGDPIKDLESIVSERDSLREELRRWVQHDHSAQVSPERPINGCRACALEAAGVL